MKRALVLILVTFLSVSCTSMEALFERTSVEIIRPDPEIRITDEVPVDGSPVMTNLDIYLKTTRKGVIPCNVWVDEVGPAPCSLEANQQTSFGEIKLYKTGQHRVRVEVTKINGKVVSDEVVFLWEPYTGLDLTALKLAQVAGSNDPTMGFILLGIALMIAFTLGGLAIGKWSGAFAGIFVSSFILVALFITVDPTVAADLLGSIIGLVVIAVFAAVAAYLTHNGYGHRGGDRTEVTVSSPSGWKITQVEERGSFTGPTYNDQPRPRLEPKIAGQLAKAILDQESQRLFLASNPDIIDAESKDIP